MSRHYTLISQAVDESILFLKDYGQVVDTGHWQGVTTEGHPDLVTKELLNLCWDAVIPDSPDSLANAVDPNLPWAEVEFQERVGGEPHNPHHSLEQWPWWRGQEGQTMHEGMFTHTYSERFWPEPGDAAYEPYAYPLESGRDGIRYPYGDLDDVVNLLVREPYTRQATFPIFFPEDTGAVHGGRIPCTLHYHFMLRNSRLHLWYAIRSCDAVRHFRDDVYMAGRLCQWVIEKCRYRESLREYEEKVFEASRQPTLWDHIKPGLLHFTAYSFHVHMGDYHRL